MGREDQSVDASRIFAASRGNSLDSRRDLHQRAVYVFIEVTSERLKSLGDRRKGRRIWQRRFVVSSKFAAPDARQGNERAAAPQKTGQWCRPVPCDMAGGGPATVVEGPIQ